MVFRWFRRKRDPVPIPSMEDVVPIINAYGALLERNPATIQDTSVLPLPKERMKVMIKMAWLSDTDPDKRRVLEVGYVLLSQFQDRIGDNPIHRSIREPNFSMFGKATTEAESLFEELQDFKRRNVQL